MEFKIMLGVPLPKCKAKTAEAAWEAYYNASGASQDEVAAILRWLEFNPSIIEVKNACEGATTGGEPERILMRHFDKLLRVRALAVESIAELELIYLSASLGGGAREVVLRRIWELSQK